MDIFYIKFTESRPQNMLYFFS